MKKWTVDFPWRSIQTNLNETDWIDMNAKQYASDLESFNANAVWLNTAGIVANYPTKLPFHFQNTNLKGDSLGDVIEECHKKNIKVISRNDFSKVRRPIFEQYPEWAYRTIKGEIVDYYGDVHVCFNSNYQQQYIFEILKELLSEYPLDAVFCNAFGFRTSDYSYNYYGICHCENCKRDFFNQYKIHLPAEEKLSSPAYGSYQKWKQTTIESFRSRFRKVLTDLKPEIAIIDLDYKRLEVNTEFGKRPLPHWQYGPAYAVKAFRGIEPCTVNISASTVDFIGYFYRHIAVTPELQELRLWQTLVNLGGIDWYLMGRIDKHQDRSGFNGIKKVFKFAREHENTFKNFKNMAQTLLLADGYTGEKDGRGWLRVLSENHILYDMAFAETLPKKELSRYKLIIVPNLAFLSDEVLEAIDSFANKGGTVIMTGETGLYNDFYEKRSSFGLKCAGIKEVTFVRNDMASAMLLLDEKDKEVFTSFNDTDLAYFGEKYLFTKLEDSAESFMKMIPPHRIGPPEKCYYTQVTDLPGLTVFKYGKGKGIHIPWLPGKLFHDEGYSNPANLMKDILFNLCALETAAVNVNPMVEMTIAEKKDELLIQLVNLTGHFGASYFPPVTLYDQAFSIKLNKKAAAINSLRQKDNFTCDYKEDELFISINKLDDYEAIHIKI